MQQLEMFATPKPQKREYYFGYEERSGDGTLRVVQEFSAHSDKAAVGRVSALLNAVATDRPSDRSIKLTDASGRAIQLSAAWLRNAETVGSAD